MSPGDLRPRPTAAIVPAGPYERAVTWLAQLGHDRADILTRAGITPEQLAHPRGLLTIDQVEALALVGAELVSEPGRTLELGGSLLFPSYGNVGLAALTAPSVREAVAIAAKYLELLTPLFVLQREHDADTLRVRLVSRYRLHEEVQRIHLEFVLSTLYGLARHGVGQVPAGFRLALPTHDPLLHGWLRERGVDVRTSDDGTTLLELSSSLAQTSFVMADASAHAGFVALCDAALRELEPHDRTTRAVRDMLQEAGPPFPGLEEVSQRLGASARTMRRRLNEQGTSYQELLDEARFAWAKRALRDSRLPVTAIAYDLGYSAPSNFTRAFRNALGTSPSAYRANTMASAPDGAETQGREPVVRRGPTE